MLSAFLIGTQKMVTFRVIFESRDRGAGAPQNSHRLGCQSGPISF